MKWMTSPLDLFTPSFVARSTQRLLQLHTPPGCEATAVVV